MAVLLAALMATVVTYCLARAFVPALHDPAHARDVDLWHVVMGAGMVAMLLVTLTRAVAALALVVFVVGLGWSAVRLATSGARPAYLRLGVGCAAMAVMLLPTATAGAAAPADATTTTTPQRVPASPPWCLRRPCWWRCSPGSAPSCWSGWGARCAGPWPSRDGSPRAATWRWRRRWAPCSSRCSDPNQ